MKLRSTLLPILVVSSLAGEVRAEDLSLKVENYIFAASEALADGEPALALSLLRRAKSEAPDSCIVEEYLCRSYVALGNTQMAREAYGRFVSCMEVSDEGVLADLDQLIVQAEQAAALEPPPVETVATPEPVPPATAVAPTPVAPAPAQVRRRGAGAAWGLMGSGAVLSAGAGVAAYMTYQWGDYYVVEGDQESYEEMALYNHAAVIGTGTGGAMVLTGFIVGVVSAARNDGAVSLGPWQPVPGGLGMTAQVEF
jgi:hypothetical protein